MKKNKQNNHMMNTEGKKPATNANSSENINNIFPIENGYPNEIQDLFDRLGI